MMSCQVALLGLGLLIGFIVVNLCV